MISADNTLAREDRLARCYRQVFTAQVALAAVAIAVAGGFQGRRAVYAVCLGAGLAMLNSWLSKRSIIKSSALAYRSPGVGMTPVFISLIQRLLLFAIGAGLGLAVWQLSPFYLLGAFMWLQLAMLACKMNRGR